jgi:hypothetical protein
MLGAATLLSVSLLTGEAAVWLRPAGAQGAPLKPDDAALIPLAAIGEAQREDVRFVAARRSWRRSVETEAFASTPEVYRFILDALPLASRLTRALGIDDYIIEERHGGRIFGDDRRGLSGVFDLVYRDLRKRIYYGEGTYDGAILPKLKGRSVLVLEYAAVGLQGQTLMQNRLTAYVRVENRAARILCSKCCCR